VVDLEDPTLKLNLVYANPLGDVGGQLIRRLDGEVVGISDARLGDAGIHYWDEDYKRLAAGIDKALPDRFNSLLQMATDGSTYLLWSDGNGIPGQVFIGNRKSGTLALLGEQYPELDPERLPKKQPLQITARDGLKLPALLTVPPGVAPRKLPLVLLPHGGPQSQDSVEFDAWSSFLAGRGYAVLQVNFRGSTGFGAKFLLAGLRRWGLQMQDDLADGVKDLVDRGIADPARVCIVGGSYGGYAALMGGIKTPGLYRCVFAFAPVTDLVDLSEHAHFRYYDLGEALDAQIGDDPEQLRATSPRLQARRMGPPVLLMHGTADRSVDYAQGEGMAAALTKAGKKVRFITQDQGDHHLSNQGHRTQFFREPEAFLLEHLGPGARTPAPDESATKAAAPPA